jgi:hypothetical protein
VKKAVAIIVLVAAVATIVFRTQQGKDRATEIPTRARKPVTNAGVSSERQSSSTFASIDAKDPEFVQQVLPFVRDFFATLDKAEVNPIKGELLFNKVQIHHGRNGTTCRFLIGESWTATTYVGARFSGILHFGERGPDNPFRAIGGANTNALGRLAERAIKMPQAEAEQIIDRISNTLGIDRNKFEKPEIYPEQMFDYDLGMYAAQYRKRGSDPINRANFPITFSIRATSSTTAVLVMYSNSGEVPQRRL